MATSFAHSGQRAPTAARFTPEEIVTGAFQTISGAITEIDAEKKEIKIKDLQSQQPVTIVVSKDSSMRTLTPEMVTALTPAKADECRQVSGEKQRRFAGDVRSASDVHASGVETRRVDSLSRARKVRIPRA